MSREQLSHHEAQQHPSDGAVAQDELSHLPPTVAAYAQALRYGDADGLLNMLWTWPWMSQEIVAAVAGRVGNAAVQRAMAIANASPTARGGSLARDEYTSIVSQPGDVPRKPRELESLAPPSAPGSTAAESGSQAAAADASRELPLSHKEFDEFLHEPGQGPRKAAPATKAQITASVAPSHAAPAVAHGSAEPAADHDSAEPVHAEAEGAEGEAAASGSSLEGAAHGRVTARKLNVRRSPSARSRSNIVGVLDQGAEVPKVGQDGAWVKIMHGGEEAYVHGQYVEPVLAVSPPTETVEAAKQIAPEAAPKIEARARQPADAAPAAASKTDAALEAEVAVIVKEFDAGTITHLQGVERFRQFAMKHGGGHMTEAGTELYVELMGLLNDAPRAERTGKPVPTP